MPMGGLQGEQVGIQALEEAHSPQGAVVQIAQPQELEALIRAPGVLHQVLEE